MIFIRFCDSGMLIRLKLSLSLSLSLSLRGNDMACKFIIVEDHAML